MEFCSCDLNKLLEQRGNLTEPQAYIIIVKILKAVRKFKSHKLVHRDLKPANIGLTFKTLSKEVRFSKNGDYELFLKNFDFILGEEDFEVKLLDLGLSENLDESGFGSNSKSGTLSYMAPE